MPKQNGRFDPRRQEVEKLLLGVLPRLKIYAHSLTRDRTNAEDLLHDTVLRVLEKFHQFQPGTNFAAWAFRVQRNLFISNIRARWPTLELNAPESVVHPKMSTLPDTSGEFRQLVPVLAYLHQDQLDCLLGSLVCQFSYEQLSQILGVDVGTVKSRVSRGRDEIEEILRADISTEDVDLSTWRDASTRVAVGDSYFPIAKAYEELYQMWTGEISVTADTANPKENLQFVASHMSRVLAEIRAAEQLDGLERFDELE